MRSLARIVHLSVFRQSIGVQRQLIFEQRAAWKLASEVQWEVRPFLAEFPRYSSINPTFVTPKHIPKPFRIWVARWKLFQWLRYYNREYDFILLRWPGVGPFSIFHADLFRYVFTVHHTKEIEELKILGSNNKLRAGLESLIGSALLRRTRGIVSVTPEIAQYEIKRAGITLPSLLYPNGIDYSIVSLARVSNSSNNKKVVFLMVASHFFPWHGLDLVLQSFQNYKSKVLFHIVGNVPSEIYQKLKNYEHFQFHGLLNAAQIAQLAHQSDVGISSLALYRKGLKEACPLKAREYLALGLPVIGGYKDSGLPEDFPYYHQIDLQKENGAQEMIAIAKYLRSYKPLEIRQESRPFIEKIQIMRNLLHQIRMFF